MDDYISPINEELTVNTTVNYYFALPSRRSATCAPCCRHESAKNRAKNHYKGNLSQIKSYLVIDHNKMYLRIEKSSIEIRKITYKMVNNLMKERSKTPHLAKMATGKVDISLPNLE